MDKEVTKKNSNSEEDVSRVVMMAQFRCQDCTEVVSTRLPPMRVLNTPELSSIQFAHQIPVKCSCGSYYIPLLATVDESMRLNLKWRKVKVAETKNEGEKAPDATDKLLEEYKKQKAARVTQ